MTKIYKSQQEVEQDIEDGALVVNEDVRFECSVSISASIKVGGDINAWDINAENINARNIDAWDINAWDISAGNINAGNIDAWDINAWDINAENISAGNILYYAFCGVYNSIKCLSIKAKREIRSEPICLDGKLEIKKNEDKIQEAIEVDEKWRNKISVVSANANIEQDINKIRYWIGQLLKNN